jgi:hypothetical protein
MTTFKRAINTSLLPNDILSYNDTQFYNVVKQFVCDDAGDFLELQGIRNADSLILIPDVFAVLNINCAALKPLKEKLCLKSDDNIYMVKPGIKSLMSYFCELIIKKKGEELKLLSKQQTTSITSISTTLNISSATNANPSFQQQQLSPAALTSVGVPSHTATLNENYHRDFIINSINKWCTNYSNLSLIEGDNYQLIVMLTDTYEIAKIKCGCGSKVSLVKVRKNFQMSNFYKHLMSRSCTMMNKGSSKTTSSEKDKNENNSSSNSDSTPQNAVRVNTVPSTKEISSSFNNKKQNGRKRAASPNVTKTKRSHRTCQR